MQCDYGFALFGLIAVMGVANIVVGTLALTDASFLKTIKDMIDTLGLQTLISESDIAKLAIVAIIGGSSINLVIVGIGLFAAQKRINPFYPLGAHSAVFFFAMVFFLGTVIVNVVLARFYPNKFHGEVTEKFKKFIDSGVGNRTEIDHFQERWECCGMNGPTDYPKDKIPDSCKDKDGKDFEKGCVDKFMEKVKNVQSPVFIVPIITLILLGLVMALFCFLGIFFLWAVYQIN